MEGKGTGLSGDAGMRNGDGDASSRKRKGTPFQNQIYGDLIEMARVWDVGVDRLHKGARKQKYVAPAHLRLGET